jgi:hypothetical protein
VIHAASCGDQSNFGTEGHSLATALTYGSKDVVWFHLDDHGIPHRPITSERYEVSPPTEEVVISGLAPFSLALISGHLIGFRIATSDDASRLVTIEHRAQKDTIRFHTGEYLQVWGKDVLGEDTKLFECTPYDRAYVDETIDIHTRLYMDPCEYSGHVKLSEYALESIRQLKSVIRESATFISSLVLDKWIDEESVSDIRKLLSDVLVERHDKS